MPTKNRAHVASAARVRLTSQVVATKPGCAPLRAAYQDAVARSPKSWQDVESAFLKGMDGFDRNVVSGLADMGDLQNGKGDFFNDLLALILENCAQVQLYSRGGVPGLIIPRHNLDVTFPSTGPVSFVLEAKAVGTPRHPGSPKEKQAGRDGAADLDKRVKEIGFKTIDLKAEFARMQTSAGESPTPMSGDLTSWLRSVKPRSYLFIAARVTSDRDRERVIRFADIAALVSDAVGLFCFGHPGAPDTSYVTQPVPSHLEIGRTLFRACQDLSSLKAGGAT